MRGKIVDDDKLSRFLGNKFHRSCPEHLPEAIRGSHHFVLLAFTLLRGYWVGVVVTRADPKKKSLLLWLSLNQHFSQQLLLVMNIYSSDLAKIPDPIALVSLGTRC